MAYNPINSNEIESGEPVKSGSLAKVRDNFNDHEQRITELESGANIAYPPILLRVNGYYGDQGPATGWIKEVINFDITITGVRLYIDTAGSSGTTEIDLQTNTSGSYASIFTTKPSVAFGAGNDAVSSNGILDSSKVDLNAGDIIRLDTTSVQTNGHSFMVRIDYNKR